MPPLSALALSQPQEMEYPSHLLFGLHKLLRFYHNFCNK
jgi:hypothetical protein